MLIARTRMNLGIAVAAALLLMFAGLAVACGGSSLSAAERDELKTELVSEGLSENEADCFIKELGGDAKRLWQSEDDELSENDFAKLFGAFIKCVDE